MEKVNQGKATKEELSKERERILAMRKELEEKMGVKLFVGRLSYEISEEELSKAFSEHGKIDSIHIAKDRDVESQKDLHSSHSPRRRKQRRQSKL